MILFARSRFQSQFLKKLFPLRGPRWAQVGPKAAPKAAPRSFQGGIFTPPMHFQGFYMKMCKNWGVFAHRIPPGLPKSSQLRFKILSFTFKFQTDSSKIQILFSIFKIPTSRALASKVQGFSIQGFSIQGLSNQRIQRIEQMGVLAPIQRLVYLLMSG